MLNIISCKKIAYRNEYKMPATAFVVGDITEMEINANGLMADSIRTGYYAFPADKEPHKAGVRDYVFGCWTACHCGCRNDVLTEIKETAQYAVDHDCLVFGCKQITSNDHDLVGMEVRLLGMDDDGNYIDVSARPTSSFCPPIDAKEWTIVYTAAEAAEIVLKTMEPLLERARAHETATATARAENRARVAELKRQIHAAQMDERPLENKVLDPNEWWASLSDQDKLNLAKK